MNREIKFRAWDEDTKQMLPPVDLSQSKDYWKWLGVQDVVIMQYTGIKDKNEKEIYEGDILKVSGRMYEIIWIEPIAGFGGRIMSDVKMFAPKNADANEYAQVIFDGGLTSDYKSFEVIGNIYENKELTKKTLWKQSYLSPQ